MSDDERINIGKFGRAHGVRGELRFFPHSPESELLEPGLRVFVQSLGGETAFEVEKSRQANKFVILKLAGVDDRDEAESLTNLEVYVGSEELPETEEGEFYQKDVLGCEVTVIEPDGTTRRIGEVAGFFETGANDVMVVDLDEGERLLVPLIEDAIDAIDPPDAVTLRPLDEWAPEGTELS